MRNSSPVALGQVIANKYQVEGVLGEGGMGVVVSAWHLGLEQRVAIKLLLSHMRDQEGSALERFQREARAAARIRSEYVCRVLDTGSLDDGTPFLVMEYLEGADLADELLRRGRFEVEEAVRYVREACLALTEAHQAGVIHRDLKPANLFLVQRPDGTRSIKVVDFGVSKSISRTGTPHMTLTKTSALVGSPIYMSPEQLNSSKDVDARTDIWALGTILYELVTGRTPFYGETIPQLVNAVLNTEPEGFARLGIVAPAGLEDVVRRALSKQRDARFSSARELYSALAPYLGDAGSISGTIPAHKTPMPTRSMSISNHTPAGGPSLAPAAPTPAETVPRRRGRALLVGLLLVAAAGVAALLSRSFSPESAAPSPSAPPAPVQVGAAPPLPSPPPALPQAPEPSQVQGVDARGSAREQSTQSPPAQPVTAGSTDAQATPPAAEAPAPQETKRPTQSARHGARPAPTAPPPASSAPQPQTNDDSLPSFGGRR